MFKAVRGRIRGGGRPLPDRSVPPIEYSAPELSTPERESVVGSLDLGGSAEPESVAGSADSCSESRPCESDLSALSDYQVVEAIAAQTARINADEGVRLKLVAELYSRPCMTPDPPDPVDPQWRAGRDRLSLDRDDLTHAELSTRLPIASGELSRLIRTAIALLHPWIMSDDRKSHLARQIRQSEPRGGCGGR
jgi:hypothetical protein